MPMKTPGSIVASLKKPLRASEKPITVASYPERDVPAAETTLLARLGQFRDVENLEKKWHLFKREAPAASSSSASGGEGATTAGDGGEATTAGDGTANDGSGTGTDAEPKAAAGGDSSSGEEGGARKGGGGDDEEGMNDREAEIVAFHKEVQAVVAGSQGTGAVNKPTPQRGGRAPPKGLDDYDA